MSRAEYIEREAAMQAVCKACNIEFGDQPCEPGDCCMMDKLLMVPAADVAPVVRGRWMPEEHEDRVSPTMTHKYTWYYCSECGRRLIGYSKPSDAPYCHCGAKMDEKEGDNEQIN